MVFQDDSCKDEWLKSQVVSKVPLILRPLYLYYNHLSGLRKNKLVFTTEVITSDWSRLFLLVTWQKQELFEGGKQVESSGPDPSAEWKLPSAESIVTLIERAKQGQLWARRCFDTWGFGFRNRLEVFKCLRFRGNLVILASGSVGRPRSCPTHPWGWIVSFVLVLL